MNSLNKSLLIAILALGCFSAQAKGLTEWAKNKWSDLTMTALRHAYAIDDALDKFTDSVTDSYATGGTKQVILDNKGKFGIAAAVTATVAGAAVAEYKYRKVTPLVKRAFSKIKAKATPVIKRTLELAKSGAKAAYSKTLGKAVAKFKALPRNKKALTAGGTVATIAALGGVGYVGYSYLTK